MLPSTHVKNRVLIPVLGTQDGRISRASWTADLVKTGPQVPLKDLVLKGYEDEYSKYSDTEIRNYIVGDLCDAGDTTDIFPGGGHNGTYRVICNMCLQLPSAPYFWRCFCIP